jgi:4-diphosphocytidyl-2-C-methyl-D-erythritol kinase
MQTISLHDLLVVERSECRVFDVVGPPIVGENLILKAARELEGRLSRQLPFTIRLFKRIPLGAGLGGGSSDAAAFLLAANALYGLKLSKDDLAEIGAQIGQDVPFFLTGGTMRATGLGSTVSALPPVPSSWRFLVIAPDITVSTRDVYQALDADLASGHRTAPLIEAISSRARATFANDLQPVTARLFPEFADAAHRLGASVPGLTMTGTGSALFSVFSEREALEDAYRKATQLGFTAWVCRPVPALT